MAADGEEALRLCRSKKYDLVVVDTMLTTSMSGLDLAKEIRKMEERNQIDMEDSISSSSSSLLIALTSAASDIGLYREARFNGCVAKGSILTEEISSILDALKRCPTTFVSMPEKGGNEKIERDSYLLLPALSLPTSVASACSQDGLVQESFTTSDPLPLITGSSSARVRTPAPGPAPGFASARVVAPSMSHF